MTDDEIRDADGCEDYESLEESGLHEEQTEAEEDAAAEELFSETDDGEPEIVEEPDAAEKALQEANEKYMRLFAEFDNFRKRTEKEQSSMYEMGARSVIEKILPVIDNFERGLQAVPEDQKDDPFVDGMNKIYKQMMTELEGIGVEAIDAVGNDFDPELHNAVMQVESDEYESGVVAQEMQKGYTYRGSVVRHSMVAVVS